MGELTFKNVKLGQYDLAYTIPEEVGRHYEELISFSRGRDFNREVRGYVEDFVKQFDWLVTPENEQALNDRLVAYNKLIVELKVNIMSATKIPSVMISGAGNYPTRQKQKELDRVHNLEGELYSDEGKNARFIQNTNQMFNPNIAARKAEAVRKKASEGFEDSHINIPHEEIIGYGVDLEGNRVYLETDGKPSDETRALLKNAAMRWSPKNQRWQRVLTKNAIYAIKKRVFEPLNIDIEV